MTIQANLVAVRNLGRSDYRETWDAMRDFTHVRDAHTRDQLWITEHAPVFTQGLNGRAEHLLDAGDIPVLQIDRGGQITYHGPGQLVLYCLLDLNRLGLGVKGLVAKIEKSVIDLLRGYRIAAHTRDGAPGVYVGQAKIAALGLRIRKGCCYHGLSLNVDMELEPFTRINPCGYRGLAVSQLRDLGVNRTVEQVGHELAGILIGNLGEKESSSTGRQA
ncbi:MAG: lipoyl(octanoyl) transferase LipB [Gammaproteobacteria bacterium]|nr:lipoyl(octanoyl) transferase LipB [Gammaproteobacteria bacterium]